MLSPNWGENAENINDYINDSNFFKCRKTEELCSFLDATKLKPDNFDLFCNNVSTYHDKHAILDILAHTNVEYGSNISEILMNINTLFHVLKIPLLLNMSKSIDSIFQSFFANSIINEIRSIKSEVKQKFDETKQVQYNGFEDIKKSQNEKLDEIKRTQNAKFDDIKWKIDDVSKNVKLQIKQENFNKMRMYQKTSADFDKIYSIFEKIVNDDDFISMRLAVDSGYHEVTADKSGYTRNIVTYGADRNNFKLVKMLVECGVNPSKNDPSGANALWFLCRQNNLEAVKYFCELPGADVNSLESENRSLLYVASFNDFNDICQYLLSLNGVDVNRKYTCDGSTALSVAKSDRVRDLLKSHGAI